jgi:hypothetical protein
MTRWLLVRFIGAFISLALGVMFACWPQNWIEGQLGSEPDGGTGLFELLLAAVPSAIGLALGVSTLVTHRRLMAESAGRFAEMEATASR